MRDGLTTSRWGLGAKAELAGTGTRFWDVDILYSPNPSGCRVQGAGFRVQGSGGRVQGSGFSVQGSGLKIQKECRLRIFFSGYFAVGLCSSVGAEPCRMGALQGYLAHKKQRPPGTLQQDYAQDPMVVIGGGAVSYERGARVPHS